MESFVFSYPTRVYFGSGAAKQALDSELGAYKKVMLAYGVASAKANGIYDEIRGALESLGKEVVDFGGITPNPKYTKMQGAGGLYTRRGRRQRLRLLQGHIRPGRAGRGHLGL